MNIMKFMAWSWQDLNECPASLVDTVIDMIGEMDEDGANGG